MTETVSEAELARWDQISLERLTPRESEVLRELMQGHNAATIAGRMYCSLPTVRTHIQSILIKLGVNSQLAAVAIAYRMQW